MTIGQRIAQKRKELGLSQEALGEALGVSRQSVYKWESGSALPEIEKLISMGRLFGVTIGWLLGVEEPVRPAAEEEKAAPPEGGYDSGELTETQLKMVEEIVDRYLAARQPPKKRRWTWFIAAAAAGIVLLTVLNSLRSDLRDMRNQCNSLQSSINSVTWSVDSQISGIANRVEEVLKNQNNLAASYGTEVVSADLAANTVTFTACAAPKTYTEGMTAVFVADDGNTVTEFPGELGANQTFSAGLTCELTNEITISVVFITGDIRETQLLDTHYGLYSDSLPDVDYDSMDAHSAMMWKKLNKAGELDWSDEYAAQSLNRSRRVVAADERIGRAEVKSIRIGLFRNQALLGWLEPCEKPYKFRGYDDGDYNFYRFPAVSVVPEAGDIFTVTAVVADEYDREYIIKGRPYELDPEGRELTYSTTDNWVGMNSPEGWEY